MVAGGEGRRSTTLCGLKGDVAEWLRSGLQSRVHRFDSGRRLSSVTSMRRARAVATTVLIVLGAALAAAPAAARDDLTRAYHLKRCPGTIHAGFTRAERRHAVHYGRYRKLSCRRARAIVRLVDRTNGPYPPGYFWETPHGAPSTYPTVFGRTLLATYLSPDGFHGSRGNPGVAVVLYR